MSQTLKPDVTIPYDEWETLQTRAIVVDIYAKAIAPDNVLTRRTNSLLGTLRRLDEEYAGNTPGTSQMTPERAKLLGDML